MEVLAIVFSMVCYGLAIFFWWHYRKPVFLLALVSGQVGVLASPLWQMLYEGSYQPAMSVLIAWFGAPLYTTVFWAAAWFYPLPALVVLYLYYMHWWKPGYVVGIVTYAGFLFYHSILESIGLRSELWSYTNAVALPLGLTNALLSSLMAALISLLLLYALLLTHRFAPVSMVLTLLGTTLLASLFVRGLLGAPLWIALVLDGSTDWIILIGALSTVVLLAVAVHIVARGLSQVEWELA